MNTIVEVPSEAGESQASHRSNYNYSDDEHRSNDEGPSPFNSEDEHSAEEDRRSEPPNSSRSTSRRPNGTTSARGRRRKDVDMTPPEELLQRLQDRASRLVEKKNDTAIQELIKCTAVARIVYGDNHWKLAKSYADLACGYFELKGYAPQAEAHSEFAKNIIKNVQMSSSSSEKAQILNVIITIYFTLGRAQAMQKKYQPASESLTKAEDVNLLRGKVDGVRRRDTEQWEMKISLAMAKLKARQKAWGQAKSSYTRALEIMEHSKGHDAPDLIPLYQGLGRVELCQGELANHEEAIGYFERAHEISSKRDPDGVTVGDTAAGLAEAYANIDSSDAELSAESYYKDAHGIYLIHYGPKHEKTIAVQDQLAHLQIRADKTEEAIETLKGTIECKKEVYGDLSGPVAETYKLIGNVHLAQQDMEKALRALKKCHNIETSLHGVNNKKTKDTQRTLDILMANPNLAAKHKKSRADEMKERPRFNSIVKRESRPGGVRTDAY